MVKKKAPQQENFVDLHDRILAGDVAKPRMLTRRGRAYRKWVKENQRLVQRAERLAKQAGDGLPVVGERPLAVQVRGFSGRWSGHASVVSGPQEWQTTTNLGAGFNPNVVGAPAPVIGSPLGEHAITGSEVGCDQLSGFREGIIANPSCFVLFGKC